MARQEMVVYFDDIDNTEDNVQPRKFSIDGVNYEIDLGPANYAKLKDALAPFIEAGTKVKGWSAKSAKSFDAKKSTAVAEEKGYRERVRAWAKGYVKIPERGRVADQVCTAYDRKDEAALLRWAKLKGWEVVGKAEAPKSAPAATFSAPAETPADTPANGASPKKAQARKAAPKKAPAEKASA